MLMVEGKTEFAKLFKRTTIFEISAVHFNLDAQCTLLFLGNLFFSHF